MLSTYQDLNKYSLNEWTSQIHEYRQSKKNKKVS